MSGDSNGFKASGKDYAKFIIPSLIGAFLFLAPIPTEDAFIIPLGIIVNHVTQLFNLVSFGTYAPDTIAGSLSIQYIIGFIAINLGFFGMILAHTLKPKFIMDNANIRRACVSSPIYFVSKVFGFIFVWMLILNVGPSAVIASWTGDVMFQVMGSLAVIFLVLIPGLPLLTEFGLMEFIGVFIKKIVRVMFTLPGRASIDLIASWFGSSGGSIIISRIQHEKGFYTNREAAAITTNFAIVSVPFTFVVASVAGLAEHFFVFYGIMSVTVLFLAVLMPRIWPLRSIPDTYLEDVGKQIEEEVPENISKGQFAVQSAIKRSRKAGFKTIKEYTVSGYSSIFLEIFPIFLAWGTIALMIVEHTQIFDVISWPMGAYLSLLQVEAAFQFAPAALVGFIDMYLPALLIGDAPLQTRMILGVLSIVQVIYLAETGILILKSRIPLNVWKLFVIFMMRTIIGLPIIVLLVKLIF